MLLRVFVGAHRAKPTAVMRRYGRTRILTVKQVLPRSRHVAPFERLASAQQHDDGAAAAGVTSGLAIGEDVVPLR